MHSTFFLSARLQLAVTVLLAIIPFISATSFPPKASRRGLNSVNQQRAVTLPPGWSFKSCTTDDPNQPTLSAGSFTNAGMTVEFCINICETAYLAYAGLENGKQCSCGNVTTAGATLSTNCNTPCVGRADQTCGGPNALDLYWSGLTLPDPVLVSNVGQWKLAGCYSDSLTTRTLSTSFTINGGVTIEKCLGMCLQNDYTDAGVQFADECWCGNGINPTGKQLDQKFCNVMACSGNSLQYCGKSQAMIIYSR